MAAAALFRCEFRSTMPRMGKVLDWYSVHGNVVTLKSHALPLLGKLEKRTEGPYA